MIRARAAWPPSDMTSRFRAVAAARSALRRLSLEWQVLESRTVGQWRRADVSFFHDFVPPPSGGGNQFLRALWGELAGRGLRLEANTISRTTRACLLNSFNFDVARLRRLKRAGCRMVHRVDGPVDVYRGRDEGIDRRILEMNREFADATIFQSRYSLQKHAELGLSFVNPQVILNAADPAIFHPHGRIPFDRGRRIRLIATSWSDNPNKGSATYRWLEERLDWRRFTFTFVGRSAVPFERIPTFPPVSSRELAALLREHDIYIAASSHDPCSNALIEALSGGLPALYRLSGGHPEIVGEAGLGFAADEEMLHLLDRLVDEYEDRQAHISMPSLSETADRYLAALAL